jgi:hypothetical protein
LVPIGAIRGQLPFIDSMAYLKDLIDLPDQVRQGDFVLRLTEGLGNPDQTLTPRLPARRFGRS